MQGTGYRIRLRGPVFRFGARDLEEWTMNVVRWKLYMYYYILDGWNLYIFLLWDGHVSVTPKYIYIHTTCIFQIHIYMNAWIYTEVQISYIYCTQD